MMSFIKDHIPASIASQIFEDEPEKPTSKPTGLPAGSQPAGIPFNTRYIAPPQFQTAPPVPVTMSVTNDIADHTDDAYQLLLAKTDFTQTPIFQTLNKYLAPLASTGLDDKMKFGIAVKQAQTIDHLDPASVVAIFDQFKSTLTDMASSFAKIIASHVDSDVTAKNNQAEQLQAQAKQLTEDAFTAQQKLQENQHRFDVALKARTDEITQEQAKYASFLA